MLKLLADPRTGRLPWGRLALAAALGAVTDLAGLALTATAAWLLATAAGQPPAGALALAIVGVRGFALARGTGRYVERLAGHDAALRFLARLRTRVYRAVADGAPGPRTPDLLHRLVSDVDAVQDALLRFAIPAAVAGLVGSVAVVATFAIEPAAAPVLAGGLFLAGVAIPALAYALSRRSAGRLAEARAGYLVAAADAVQGAADLIAFGAREHALDRAARLAAGVARLERKAAGAGSVVAILGAAVPGLTAVTVLVAAIAAGRSGPWVAVLGLLALVAVEAVVPLGAAAARLSEWDGAAARTAETLHSGAPQPDGRAPGEEVRLDGVAVREVLTDVTVCIPPGRRVGITGPSGSGKSTLLNVIAGLVAPDRGRVSAGAYTSVLADAHVFHASVRDNLTLGRPIGDTDLAEALRTAGLPHWVDRLDDILGEDGRTVSGGERQRLLIARALAETRALPGVPPLLLLDEPTEGLDRATADEVVGAVLAAAGGRTVLWVTHREAELALMDEVLTVRHGRVVPAGESGQV
jgi:ATP-binding cassette subfamily C protein CydC